MRVPVEDLVELATGLLVCADVRSDDALLTARLLVEADARGRTGHGLVRLEPYLDRIEAGGLNPRPDVRVLVERPSSAQVDGDNGLGQVVVSRATELAVAKATATGVGVVGTRRSNHAGAAGLYALRAAEAGHVGIYCAVANANGMPPWGGSNPILGTNPIAVAVPSTTTPFLLDIATTAASHGTIKATRAAGQTMPEGWVVDVDGRPITDPARADEGFLLPMGGHKGAGLAVAVGLLAGVLNGAAFGSSVVDARKDLRTPTGTGQLVIAIAADIFRSATQVLPDVADALDELRSSDGPEKTLRLPGDRSAEGWAAAQRDGVDLPGALWERLRERATYAGVPVPD